MRTDPSVGVYVALEGIKGSGKSTLFRRVCQQFEEANVRFSRVEPTRCLDPDSLIERLYASESCLHDSRPYRSLVYANRSFIATHRCDWSAPVVIGDRSVITSYATNWHLHGSHSDAVSFVDTLEPFIKAPDLVVLVETPAETCVRRIKGRINKGPRLPDIDESRERLIEMSEAYAELETSGIPRLQQTLWSHIDGTGPPDVVEHEFYATLENVLTSHTWSKHALLLHTIGTRFGTATVV